VLRASVSLLICSLRIFCGLQRGGGRRSCSSTLLGREISQLGVRRRGVRGDPVWRKTRTVLPSSIETKDALVDDRIAVGESSRTDIRRSEVAAGEDDRLRIGNGHVRYPSACRQMTLLTGAI